MTTMKLPFDGKYIEPGGDPIKGPAPAGRVPPEVLAKVHDDWVLAWADKIPAPGPDDGVDASAFHVDLNATPEAMADFDRRLDEAMRGQG